MELSRVWKLYIRTDSYTKKCWFNLWPLPKCQTRGEYFNSTLQVHLALPNYLRNQHGSY